MYGMLIWRNKVRWRIVELELYSCVRFKSERKKEEENEKKLFPVKVGKNQPFEQHSHGNDTVAGCA